MLRSAIGGLHPRRCQPLWCPFLRFSSPFLFFFCYSWPKKDSFFLLVFFPSLPRPSTPARRFGTGKLERQRLVVEPVSVLCVCVCVCVFSVEMCSRRKWIGRIVLERHWAPSGAEPRPPAAPRGRWFRATRKPTDKQTNQQNENTRRRLPR